MAIDVNALRHPRERTYQTLMYLFGAAGWLGITVSTMGSVFIIVPMMAGLMWLAGQVFKAKLLGNAPLVSERQYPELHKMVLDGCQQLGIETPPKVFVLNGGGAINALAVKFSGGSYVLLYASLVDMMVDQKMGRELKMIICHELGHHAAGHVSGFKNLIIGPAKMVPYLGMAYSRACEFTADRLGTACVGDVTASKRALVAMAVGSTALKTDLKAFADQEAEISRTFGRWAEIYATHPRMTRRVLELDSMVELLPKRATRPLEQQKLVAAAPNESMHGLDSAVRLEKVEQEG